VIAIAAAALIASGAAACGKKGDDQGGEGEGKAKSAEKAAEPGAASPVDPAEPTPAAASDPEPAAAAAAVPTSEEQATADKAAVVLEELGKIAESSRGSCDKAAAAMKSVIDKNRAVLSAAEKLGRDEGKEQWLAEKYGPRTDAAKSKLMPLMEKCADHEGIATVFDSIE
jgi:hypothetical protein